MILAVGKGNPKNRWCRFHGIGIYMKNYFDYLNYIDITFRLISDTILVNGSEVNCYLNLYVDGHENYFVAVIGDKSTDLYLSLPEAINYYEDLKKRASNDSVEE